MDGTTYTHALSRQLSGCQRDSAWPFDIGRDWTWFTTTVGVSDKSDFDVAVRFEIYADGNLVRTADVSFGEADTLTVPVTGVLELELRSTFVKGNMGLCSSAGYAVWGDPTLRR
ncbi:NPCBM/NEW2 domain-containing protein [Skermania piniformis]|uniref:NPCBM/NEW2 domain-containing protein n=1 Tax=Skermania pinensis TaxID=39122 RepID=A0ABX8S7D4_9ACTN|nr:NPCBM/NEW2 domain-containing protein [Skermania piniformis]QXQ12420.1 NPCBM/NEW2 domain-containing protein [Skermania piniformis]